MPGQEVGNSRPISCSWRLNQDWKHAHLGCTLSAGASRGRHAGQHEPSRASSAARQEHRDAWKATLRRDGDDKPEFVVPDSGGWTTPEQGRVWVLKATSNGSFAAKDYDVGFSASSVAVGDLNGDGKADIVASGQDGVHVLLNDGSGQFPTVAKYAAGIYGVALADLDGDGKPDIVGGGSVMFNIGSGAFAVAKSLDINGAGLQFADLNGDGKVDAAAVSYSCAGIILYLNDGKGALRPSYRLPDAVQPSSPLLTLSDVSGDGSPDLVIVNGSTLSVRLHK